MIPGLDDGVTNAVYACAVIVGVAAVVYAIARGKKFLAWLGRSLAALSLGGMVILGGMTYRGIHEAFAKTNDTQQAGGDLSNTNDVGQVEGGTNGVSQTGGPRSVAAGFTRGGAEGAENPSTSAFSVPPRETITPVSVTDDDIVAGWKLGAISEAEEGFAARRPANAVVYEPWRRRGAHIDAFSIPAVDWMFRSTHDGYLDGIVVGSWGEFMPHIATNYFPRPFPDADLSLLPEGRWGMLPCVTTAPSPSQGGAPGGDGEGAVVTQIRESLFWYAASPSNSLMLTWQNAAYGRDANCPTNFQAELFPDGGFVYRYQDRTERYVAVSPWDWDGDGLENSVDPEPKTAGPDAHGTNAEWFNNVCSNVFAATESAEGTIELEPRSSAVNTNAYYFVDVMAADGPAPIYFNGDQPGRLGSPVVMARAGETNHVPLLIGVEYAVTSPAPFTVSVPTNGFATVWMNNGCSSDYTVKWPLNFTFTEGVSQTSRTYTVDVGPLDPGGTFTWGGASLQNAPLPDGDGGDSCNCVSGAGNMLTFCCSSTCSCGGHCRARGRYWYELASFPVEGGSCRCGFDDPSSSIPFLPPLGASLQVASSSSSVIFEDAYVDAGHTEFKRSTRIRLAVAANGGPYGGTLTLSTEGLEHLSSVACGPMYFPDSRTLAPFEPFNVSFLCEGNSASVREKDVIVSGRFCEAGTDEVIVSAVTLTVVRVEFKPRALPPNVSYQYVHRHTLGIGEFVDLSQFPSAPLVTWDCSGNGQVVADPQRISYQCPYLATQNPLKVRLPGVAYTPLLSVLEPEDILPIHARLRTYGLSAGHAGGVGVVQQFQVVPLSVSFSQIAVEEVPCNRGRAVGYFRYALPSNRWTHTREAGAGRWFNVHFDNVVDGLDNGEDEAALAEELLPMTPDGVLTNDVRVGWQEGEMEWEIPFGWNVGGTEGVVAPLGEFAADTIQLFMITSSGDCGVRKFHNQAQRDLNDRRRFNGRVVTDNEVKIGE